MVSNGAPRWLRQMAGVLLLTLIGLGAWGLYVRVTGGLAASGLTSVTPWGTWVAFYIYFVGLSAGAFLLSSLVYAFGMQELEGVGRLALLSAIVSMATALLFILLDLGRMDRFLNTLLYFNWTSPLAWEVRFYGAYIALLVTELYLAMRQDLLHLRSGSGPMGRLARWLTPGQGAPSAAGAAFDHKWLRILGLAGIPLAIFGVHGGTGTIFAVVKARGVWHSGLFPVFFVASALLSGTALLVLLQAARNWWLGRRQDRPLLQQLGRLLLMFIFLDLGLEFYEYLVEIAGQEPHNLEIIHTMAFGPYAWTFWVLQLGLAAVLPAAVLLHPRWRQSPAGVITAAAMVVAGVVGVRFNIVVPPLVVPVLDGLPHGHYTPTWVEWATSAGLIAFGLGLFALLAAVLPLDRVGEGVEAHD